jgi:hypothetical protein
MLKFENKFFNEEKIKGFINEISYLNYHIFTNTFNNANSFLKNFEKIRQSVMSNSNNINSSNAQQTSNTNNNINNNNQNNINITNKNEDNIIQNSVVKQIKPERDREKAEINTNSGQCNKNNSNSNTLNNSTLVNTNHGNTNSINVNFNYNTMKIEVNLVMKLNKIYSVFIKAMNIILCNYFSELIINAKKTEIQNQRNSMNNNNLNINNIDNNNNLNNNIININNQVTNFLCELKSNIEKPDFIWNKNYRKELKLYIVNILKKISEKKFNFNFDNMNTNINNIISLSGNINQNQNQINNINLVSNLIENSSNINTNNNNMEMKTNLSVNTIPNSISNLTTNQDKFDYEIVNIDHLEPLQMFEYNSSKRELKIGKIFIRIYNRNNIFILENPNQFLEALKQNLIDIEFENFNFSEYRYTNNNNNNSNSNTISNIKKNNSFSSFLNNFNYFYYDKDLDINVNITEELLKAISKVINSSKADEKILIKDNTFIEKFYKLINENIKYFKESNKIDDEKNINDKNINISIGKNKEEIRNDLKNFNLLENLFNPNNKIDSTIKSNINNNNNNNPVLIDLIPSFLNLLYNISMINPEATNFVINHNIIFILLKIINIYSTKNHIEPILKILNIIIKNPEFIDKLNISIFLFLLKKLVVFKDFSTFLTNKENNINKLIEKINYKIKTEKEIPNHNLEEISMWNEEIKNHENKRKNILDILENIYSLGFDIIKLIKKYISNERIGFAIKAIFEFYLPNKIIDSLFLSKETKENSLNRLGEELELPDLIWNKEAIDQSKIILDEDTIFILNDEINLDEFPHNLITHKLSLQKIFFFEISEEYRLDNIYIRIFNKDPSYNLGKNLILFLKQVFNDSIESYKKLAFFEFVKENILDSGKRINLIDNEKKKKLSIIIIENLKKQIFCGFTAILLIIEQINFNDFNDNLGISSSDEMKNLNLLKDENEKHLISLVQRSFDFQNLLSDNFIKKLTDLILCSLGINKKIQNKYNMNIQKKINYNSQVVISSEKNNNNIGNSKSNMGENLNDLNNYSYESEYFKRFFLIDENIRLIFLQILYLLIVNKKGINLIYNQIEINELLNEFYLNEENITDGKYLLKINKKIIKIK